MVDEIESGIYYARQRKLAEALCTVAREYDSQLIMTSHSEEWLDNFISVTKDAEDVAFWRMERRKDYVIQMRRFTAKEFASGLSMGEMR
jgi:AAA15 family ATPase/GTPase